jgi:hypothetical protein
VDPRYYRPAEVDTLLGEGAYFAPELGNVWVRYGGREDPDSARETLKAWMQAMPSNVEGRRQMPQFNLTDQELDVEGDFGRAFAIAWQPPADRAPAASAASNGEAVVH